MMGWWS